MQHTVREGDAVFDNQQGVSLDQISEAMPPASQPGQQPVSRDQRRRRDCRAAQRGVAGDSATQERTEHKAQYDIQRRDSLRDDSRTNFPVLIFNPAAGTYARAGLVRSNNLRMDWLFSFQPSPGTVLFAGYGSSMTETDPFTFRDIRRTGDGFFVKLSYLLRL